MNEATARELLQRLAASGHTPIPDWSRVCLRAAYEDHIEPIRAQSARLLCSYGCIFQVEREEGIRAVLQFRFASACGSYANILRLSFAERGSLFLDYHLFTPGALIVRCGSRPSGKNVGAILNSMPPIHSTGALRCTYATAA